MLRTAHRTDRIGQALSLVTWLYLPIAVACAIGLAVDDRRLLGEPVWVKPFKFAVSIGLAGWATSWLRNRLPRRRGTDRATVAITVALVGEQALISLQAARGVRSHFNVATPFDNAVFSAMGALVAVAFAGLIVVALHAARGTTGDRVVDAAVRWGTWLVVGGAAVGFALVAARAHTIGGPDGGPGLPLVGWSTRHGDLRPGHFVGLHGLQAMIVLAAVAGRARWPQRRTLVALRIAGVAVATLTVALVVQAYARQPVTSASSFAVVAAAVIGAAAAARSAPAPDADRADAREPVAAAR